MKNIIIFIVLLISLVGLTGCDNMFLKDNNINSNSENSSNLTEKENKNIQAGDYTLEYGKYENQTYTIEEGGGSYILNEDGTFTCTNFQGTASGTYTVSLETYTNSADTLTDWLICFTSSNKENVLANTDWIIDGNNQFSGIQDGGTLKYIEK